jgi:hypothetical protein
MPPRRRHRTGQRTVTIAARTQSFPIHKHIEALLGSLYMDMAAFKKAIETFDRRSSGGVPIALQGLLNPYCQSIFHFADSYKVQPGRVGRKARQSVESLYKALMQFDADYSELKKVVRIPKTLNLIICDLISAINHFVRQCRMTISSSAVTNPVPLSGNIKDWSNFIEAEKELLRGQGHKKVLSHRPINWPLRECFYELTSKYQAIHGDHTFLKFDKFRAELKSYGEKNGVNLNCSERTYRNLKKRWKSGTLDNVV